MAFVEPELQQARATKDHARATQRQATETGRLADAHARQAAALERIADVLEAALTPAPQDNDGRQEADRG